jgi:hypothetical protein
MGEPSKCFSHLPGSNHNDERSLVIMASTVFTIESLSALGARLAQHAELLEGVYTNPWDIEHINQAIGDIKRAVSVCTVLAKLRFELADYAAKLLENQHWHVAAVVRDLRIILDDTQDWPEASRSSHHSP